MSDDFIFSEEVNDPGEEVEDDFDFGDLEDFGNMESLVNDVLEGKTPIGKSEQEARAAIGDERYDFLQRFTDSVAQENKDSITAGNELTRAWVKRHRAVARVFTAVAKVLESLSQAIDIEAVKD